MLHGGGVKDFTLVTIQHDFWLSDTQYSVFVNFKSEKKETTTTNLTHEETNKQTKKSGTSTSGT